MAQFESDLLAEVVKSIFSELDIRARTYGKSMSSSVEDSVHLIPRIGTHILLYT